MIKLKFDVALIEDDCTRRIYLEWFKDFEVDWKNTIWIMDEKYKNSPEVYLSAAGTGRNLYTQRSYLRPIILTKELNEWM